MLHVITKEAKERRVHGQSDSSSAVSKLTQSKGIDADDEWPRNSLAVNLHFCFKRKYVESVAALL